MDTFVPIFVFVPLGIFVIVLSTRSIVAAAERSWLVSILIAALLLRMGLAMAFAMFPELRVFHQDAQSYENMGMLLASSWRGEAPGFQTPAVNWGFYELSALIYYVFGRYRVNVSLFNAVLGTILTLVVYNLAKRLFHQVVARRTALFIAFMPSMILWGSMALKDVLVTFLIVLSLSSCIALKQKLTPGALLGTVLPILAIYPIRFYIIYFLVFAILVSLLLDRGLAHLSGIYRQLFVIATIAGLFLLLGLTDQAEQDASRYASLDYLSRYRRGMAVSANSGFGADIDISQPGSALSYLPIGMAHLLFAPFPWQMTSLGPLVAAPETILWWTMFPATARGIIFSVRNRLSESLPLIAFTGTLTLVYSLMQGNVGAAFRQRAQILVFLFIFSALGAYVSKARASAVDPKLLLRESDAHPTPLSQV